MNIRLSLAPLLLSMGCASSQALPPAVPAPVVVTEAPPTEPVVLTPEVTRLSEVTWEALNPARGDQSPMAGTLWGDRGGEAPTGFLLRPVDGFKSPPHIHNVSYRGVVISGLIHNDDPTAESMWMPVGSFWTQPAGAAHITSATGTDTLAIIEIDSGPYLVQPVEEAFDRGERPINVHTSNVVWLDAADNLQVSPLWGRPFDAGAGGAFVRLSPGRSGLLNSSGAGFLAVVIQGDVAVEGASDDEPLAPGSLITLSTEGAIRLTCPGSTDCVLYVRGDGVFDINSSQNTPD